MMQSRENGQKPQFGQIFDYFGVKYLQIANFCEKQVSFKLNAIFSTNFRPKTKKVVRAVFEKNIKVSDFGLIWRPFCEYFQIKKFFKNLFYLYSPITSCKKSEKFLEPFLRKLRYQPTNQPTNQLLPTTPILLALADAGLINVQFTRQIFCVLKKSFRELIC